MNSTTYVSNHKQKKISGHGNNVISRLSVKKSQKEVGQNLKLVIFLLSKPVDKRKKDQWITTFIQS